MSRWDALKPGSDRTSKYSASSKSSSTKQSNRRLTQHAPRNAPNEVPHATGNQFLRTSRPTDNTWRRGVKVNGDSGRSTQEYKQLLKDQLALYNSNSDNFQRATFSRTLRSFMDDTARSEMKSVPPDTVALIMDLFDIQLDGIQEIVVHGFHQLLREQRLILSKKEVIKCLTHFKGQCKQSATTNSQLPVECLAYIVSYHAKSLPVEGTTQEIVSPILLEHFRSSKTPTSTKLLICKVISELLCQSKYVSAVLAPLVQDVSVDGKEETTTNPNRQQLFLALQEVLFASNAPDQDNYSIKSQACQTLAQAIDALQKTNVSGAAIRPPQELDQIALNHFLTRHLLYEFTPMFEPTAALLRAILHTFPKATSTTKFASSLLFPDHPSIRHSSSKVPTELCPRCGSRTTQLSAFLALIHTGIATRSNEEILVSTNLAIQCLADLLVVLPWGLWLTQSKSNTTPSGFHRKVVDSLCGVVKVSFCLVSQQREDLASSMTVLCRTVFDVIPWNDERLLPVGVDLWAKLASLVYTSTPIQQFKNPEPTATMRVSSLIIADILVASMGGRVTPQGNLSPMTLPAQTWLSQDVSRNFLQETFQQVQNSHDDRESISLRILCALLRTRPQVVLVLWKEFEMWMRTNLMNHRVRPVVINVLQAFMLGRRDFSCNDDMQDLEVKHTITELVCQCLEMTRDDVDDTHQVCQLLVIYETLTKSDWEYIGQDSARLTSQISELLRQCTNHNAKVRSAACKAVGEFCSQYLTSESLIQGSDTSLAANFAEMICTRMVEIIQNDRNTQTRSMGLFALGNLALAMDEHNAINLINSETKMHVARSVHSALSDSNDKVVGNAIRSVGHWGSLVAQDARCESATKSLDQIVVILDSLSLRLSHTVALSLEEQRVGLTWKERSAAKRHGWGACNAVARIFSSLVNEDPPLRQAAFKVLQLLIQCLEKYQEIPEKVVLSAMTALRALTPSQLTAVVGKGSLIGDGLAACILLLCAHSQDDGVGNSKLTNEANVLFSYLLESASINDVVVAMKKEDFTKAVMNFVYTWMVEHDVDGRAFEIFAMAFQRPGLALSDHVSMAQNFASRAMLQHKKELSLLYTSNNEGTGDIDGLDEL